MGANESLIGRKIVCVREHEGIDEWITIGKTYTIYEDIGDFVYFRANNEKPFCYVARYINDVIFGDFVFKETFDLLKR